MTCIIGYEHDGTTIIAGDSVGISGWMATQRTGKVFRLGDMVIGYTSSFRMGQLIQHCFEPPSFPATGVNERYFVREFIPALRDLFEEHGYGKRGGETGDEGGSFLIGAQGKLFAVDNDYQVETTPTGILAIGVGGTYALGAMTALHPFVLSGEIIPQSAVERAMAAVVDNCIGARLPMTMMESHGRVEPIPALPTHGKCSYCDHAKCPTCNPNLPIARACTGCASHGRDKCPSCNPKTA